MSEAFLDLILAFTIIIACAKLGGYISIRLGQPSVLGELLVGVILGPTILDMFGNFPLFHEETHVKETVTEFAELGVLLLMMLAGLELHISELIKSGKVAGFAGTLGVFVPVLMGYGTGLFFGLESNEAIFVGLALSATSVSISAQTLMELNVLRSRVGLALLGAAVFDDILVILLLSIASIFASGGSGEGGSVIVTIVRMVGYLIGAAVLGYYLIPRLAVWVNKLRIFQGLVAFALVILLLYAWSAEVIGGMAGITGAFIVGLLLAQTPFVNDIEQGITAMAYGFFVPIFFVNIGLSVNLGAISGSDWIFAIILTLVAILSKIIGCGFGGRLGGLGN
ncbi:MAG: cation:proton antiporter, partial [Chloroflexi bacterium]|nr:cation:proton antiporter [Chloroflexota bacterium]